FTPALFAGRSRGMGFWSRLAAFAQRQAGTPAAGVDPVGSELFSAFNDWAGSAAGGPVYATTPLYPSAVTACVAVLAEDAAKLPIIMQRRLPNGGKQPVRARDHYLARLLKKPNQWQTRFEFIEMLMAALVLRSQAFAVILRDPLTGIPWQLV